MLCFQVRCHWVALTLRCFVGPFSHDCDGLALLRLVPQTYWPGAGSWKPFATLDQPQRYRLWRWNGRAARFQTNRWQENDLKAMSDHPRNPRRTINQACNSQSDDMNINAHHIRSPSDLRIPLAIEDHSIGRAGEMSSSPSSITERVTPGRAYRCVSPSYRPKLFCRLAL